MAEYVVDAVSVEPYVEVVDITNIGLLADPTYIIKTMPEVYKYVVETFKMPERITRCRDCKHDGEQWELHQGGVGYRLMECFGVDPNGFCAWAEPNEGE